MRWLILACAVGALLAQGWKTEWSYSGPKGPDHWGDLDPDYAPCKSGKAQSPIDIRGARKAALPSIEFDYRNGAVRLINNGFTAVRVNYPRGNGNILRVGNERYELTQFHFHHPSEEQVDGKAFDLGIHFMHQSAEGKVAGVAVLVNAGSASETARKLWEHMPQTTGPEHEISGLEINPAGLLPRDLSYYSYTGSQTAPPCTEGVAWLVLKTPIEVSRSQIEAFAKLYPHDVRPVQPLNGRVVEVSQ
jgi:carbonic anhydrase